MIRLNCTKKLASKLPIQNDGHLPSRFPAPEGIVYPSDSKLSGWTANLITLQRRQCVLMVHDVTRFPVFLPALKKDDFDDFDHRFEDAFMNTLLKCGADQDLMERAHRELAPLTCDTQCNRSVLGTMNHMVEEIRWMFQHESVQVAEITGYRVGAWLADQPLSAKGVKETIWPVKAMRTLLS